MIRLLVFTMTMGVFSACATLRNEVYFRASNLDTHQSQFYRTFGVELTKEQYASALNRWPWAEGMQLHRRALILALGADAATLSSLDRNRDPHHELTLIYSLSDHLKLSINER